MIKKTQTTELSAMLAESFSCQLKIVLCDIKVTWHLLVRSIAVLHFIHSLISPNFYIKYDGGISVAIFMAQLLILWDKCRNNYGDCVSK